METLDKYFENVCELDIMFNLEKAHFILGAYGRGVREGRAWGGASGEGAPHGSRSSRQASFFPPPPSPDEMVMNGCIVETNKTNVLKPILLLEKVAGK